MAKKRNIPSIQAEEVGGERPTMYVFDLEKIMDFVFDNSNPRSASNVKITEDMVEEDGKMITKARQIKESKGSDSRNSACDNIRYDLMKMFIASLDAIPISGPNMEANSFAENLILNTMLENEFIKMV